MGKLNTQLDNEFSLPSLKAVEQRVWKILMTIWHDIKFNIFATTYDDTYDVAY